eukprot:6334945-Amphidinium_carterae.1
MAVHVADAIIQTVYWQKFAQQCAVLVIHFHASQCGMECVPKTMRKHRKVGLLKNTVEVLVY